MFGEVIVEAKFAPATRLGTVSLAQNLVHFYSLIVSSSL